MDTEENVDAFIMKRMGRPLKVFKIPVAELTANRKMYDKIKNVHIRKMMTIKLSPEQVRAKFKKLKNEQLTQQHVLANIGFEHKDVGKSVKQICETGAEFVEIPLSDLKRHFQDPMYQVISFLVNEE
jgi:hypothetical protein